MHRTLKQETLKPPSLNIRRQQTRFDAFRTEYNEERPREGLGDQVPASLYAPSTRPFPRRLRSIEYPLEFLLRKVTSHGRIGWQGASISISRSLEGEIVGLKHLDEILQVHFAHMRLGFIDEHHLELGLIRFPGKNWARVK